MSHSTVIVVGPRSEEELATALAPFDENVEVDRYVSMTKADQVAGRRKRQAQAAENRERLIKGEAPYDRHVSNPAHLRWIIEGAPAEARLDDDALWHVVLETETWNERDDEGNVWSTYNPKSKWDWYAVGGRWHGGLRTLDGRDVDTCLRSELDVEKTSETFAVLDQDGEWHERGRMGWFGMVANEKDDWPDTWRKLVDKIPADAPLWLVDVHI